MSAVVLIAHAGVPCALPSAQVLAGAKTELDEIRLFDRPELRAHRQLVVETAVGRRRLACSAARLTDLRGAHLAAVPAMLLEPLALPHVVGISDGPDGIVWLIDLGRWEDP